MQGLSEQQRFMRRSRPACESSQLAQRLGAGRPCSDIRLLISGGSKGAQTLESPDIRLNWHIIQYCHASRRFLFENDMCRVWVSAVRRALILHWQTISEDCLLSDC